MAKVRDYAYRVTVDLDGNAEIDFGDVWARSSEAQGVDGGRVVMALVGRKLIEVGQKALRSRVVIDDDVATDKDSDTEGNP